MENLETLTMTFSQDSLVKISNIFKPEVRNINIDLIDIIPAGDRIIYYSVREAKENKFKLYPGPMDVVKEIELAGGILSKPIKLTKITGSDRYELIEGRIKFWAWMILFDSKSEFISKLVPGENIPNSFLIVGLVGSCLHTGTV